MIPPNTTLLFTITLLEAHPLETLIDDIAAILATVTNKKLRGNEHFLRQEFEESVHCYSKGIKLLEKIDERQKEVTETLNKLDLASEEGQYAQPLLQAKLLTPEQKSSILALHIDLLNNIASAQLKLELPHKTLETSEKVLKLSPNNPKALLRNVQGHRMLNNIDEGVAILKEAFKNDPSLKTISNLREEYSLFIKLQAESDKKDRKLYQKMVASLGDNNNNNNNSSSSSSTNDLWSNWEQTKWRNPQFLLLWVVIITGVVIASWIRWSGILDFPSESSSSLPSSLPSSEAAAAAATAKAVLLEGDYEEF